MSKGKKKNSSKSIIDGADELIRTIETKCGKCLIGRMYQTGNGNGNGDRSIKILNELGNSLDLKLYQGSKNSQLFRVIAPSTGYASAVGFLKDCIAKTNIYIQ